MNPLRERDVCPRQKARPRFGSEQHVRWAVVVLRADLFKEQERQTFLWPNDAHAAVAASVCRGGGVDQKKPGTEQLWQELIVGELSSVIADTLVTFGSREFARRVGCRGQSSQRKGAEARDIDHKDVVDIRHLPRGASVCQ